MCVHIGPTVGGKFVDIDYNTEYITDDTTLFVVIMHLFVQTGFRGHGYSYKIHGCWVTLVKKGCY